MPRYRSSLPPTALFLCSVSALAFAQLGCSSNDGESSRGERVGTTSEADTKECADASVEGIDIYDGQGTINWPRVKAGTSADGGFVDGGAKSFAFIKATQGDYNTQAKFASNWTNAKSAGVLRSAYHFFDPTIDGTAQANYFLGVVGADRGELPAMLDIECPTDAVQANAAKNCEYAGNSGWVAPATLSTRIFDFLATVEKATGRKPILYSYPSWFASNDFTDARLASYPLYIASLNACATVPTPWTETKFWQYSFTGTVPGISGQCDLDRWIGTQATLDVFAFGEPDSGASDGGILVVPDAGSPTFDAGPPLLAVQANANADGGCGCEMVGSTGREAPGVWIGVIAGALLIARRKRSHPEDQ